VVFGFREHSGHLFNYDNFSNMALATLSFRISLCGSFALGTSLDLSSFLSILLSNAFALSSQEFSLFFCELLTSLLLLLKHESLATVAGLLSTTSFVGLPRDLECLLSVFLVSVLDQSDGLRCEHFHEPGTALGLVINSLGFRPHIQIKDSLNNVVVLNFTSLFGRNVSQALVHPEVEV